MNNIYNVINEIIDHETYKKHVKPDIDTKSSEYKSQLKKILKTFFTEKGSKMPKRNLTIPYNSLKVTKLKSIDKQIIEYLNNNGFQCNEESYEIGMCTNPKGKQVSIYNILKQINEYDTEKLKSQLKEVDNDKAKESIQKKIKQKENFENRYFTHYSKINNMMNRVIVFTWVPRKIASQSTKVAWESCLTLFNGQYREFVPTGIEAGQFIAYLVTKGDENKLDKPMARLLIKPFITEEGTVFWYPQSKVYPKEGNEKGVNKEFKNKVINFVRDRQNLDFSKEEFEEKAKLFSKEKQYKDATDEDEETQERFPENYKKQLEKELIDSIKNGKEINSKDFKRAIHLGFDNEMIKQTIEVSNEPNEIFYDALVASIRANRPELTKELLKDKSKIKEVEKKEPFYYVLLYKIAERHHENDLMSKFQEIGKKALNKNLTIDYETIKNIISMDLDFNLIRKILDERNDLYFSALYTAIDLENTEIANKLLDQPEVKNVKNFNSLKKILTRRNNLSGLKTRLEELSKEKFEKEIDEAKSYTLDHVEQAISYKADIKIFKKIFNSEQFQKYLKEDTVFLVHTIIRKFIHRSSDLGKRLKEFIKLDIVKNTLQENAMLVFLNQMFPGHIEAVEYLIDNDLVNFNVEHNIKEEFVSKVISRKYLKILKKVIQYEGIELNKQQIEDIKDFYSKEQVEEIFNAYHGNINESFVYSINEINKIFR